MVSQVVQESYDRFNASGLNVAKKTATGRNRPNRRLFLVFFKSENPCIDCGEDDPVVLEFDHRDLQIKKFTISQGMSKSWEELLQEISKCDVRCANCHRKKSTRDGDHLAVRAYVTEATLRRRRQDRSNRKFEDRQATLSP